MLISEVKDLIKNYNENDLRLLVAEMYKSMPKRLREEKDIDNMIKDVQSYMRIGKIEKKLDKKVGVKELKIEVDRETLPSSLIKTLVKNLNSTDLKEITIEECFTLKNSLGKYSSSNISDYSRKEKINYLVELVFRLNMALCEYDMAIKYFKENHIEREREITIYILLSLLIEYNLKDYWIVTSI